MLVWLEKGKKGICVNVVNRPFFHLLAFLSLVTNAEIKVDWFTLHKYDAVHYEPKQEVKSFMWQTRMSNPWQAQGYQKYNIQDMQFCVLAFLEIL